MAWHGSPTAVTGCPLPPPNSPASSNRCATDVSWYSSSSTTRYCSRRIAPTSGRSWARAADSAIWSPKSSSSRPRFSCWYAAASSARSRRAATAHDTSLTHANPRLPGSNRANSAASRVSNARRRSAGTRCSASSPDSASRSATSAGSPLTSAGYGPGADLSTFAANWYRVASASSRAVGSRPIRIPWSLSSCPAKAWYVAIRGSPDGCSDSPGPGGNGSGSVTPAWTSALRTRSDSSPAALLVKVRPSTWSGATCPVPASHTTRAAITVVFPEPAPATITPGASGAVTHANCSGVNGMPSSSFSCSGRLMRVATLVRLSGPTDVRWRGHLAAAAPPRLLPDVPPLRPGRTRSAERAVRAVLPGRRREPLVQHPPRRGGEQILGPLPLQRRLPLHRGQRVAAVPPGRAQPQLHEFGAAGRRPFPAEHRVDGAFAHGELIDGQLRVAGHLRGGRLGAAGLEVHDVRLSFGVGLDPVHAAADAHLDLARVQGDVEVVLGGDGGAAAFQDVPAQEALQGGAGVVLLLAGLPGRVEGERVPHGVQPGHQDVQIGGGTTGGDLIE